MARVLVMDYDEDTKNYGRYVERGNKMNKVYLDKGGPKTIVFVEVVGEEAAELEKKAAFAREGAKAS